MLFHNKLKLSPKTTVAICIFVVIVALATFLPYITARQKSEVNWQGVTTPMSFDAIRYFARTNDVLLRDNIYPNNPYLYEHRNEPSPTPSLNDAAVGLFRFFGASFNTAYYANIAFWSFLFMLFLFLLLKEFGIPPHWATLGVLWVYIGNYDGMLQPGALQIVYPLFLLFLLFFVRLVQGKSKSILPTAIVVGLAAYSYIFLFMTALAIMGVSVLGFAIQKNWERAKQMLKVIVLGIVITLPHFINVMFLSNNPFYAETLNRIIFISSHWPQIEAYYNGRWILVALLLIFVLDRSKTKALDRTTAFILGATGLGIFIAMISNIVLGRDFDIAVHVALFSIVWYLITIVLLVRPLYKFIRQPSTKKYLGLLVLLLFLLLVFQAFMNLSRNTTVINLPKERVTEAQTYRGTLDWLGQQPEGVVFAPPGLNTYIPMLTKHYTLFDHHSTLFLASNKEISERYLLAHAFEGIGFDDFIADHDEYNGPSPSRLVVVSRLKYQFCKIFKADNNCPQEKPLEAFIDVSGLREQYNKYYPGLSKHIKEEYAKYHVRYVVSKSGEELPPEIKSFCRQSYSDQWFSVCVTDSPPA